MTVGAGSGWSNADKSAYNSRLTTLENAVYSRLNSLENKVISRLTILENKVNTSLQKVGAGIGIEYKEGSDKTCKDCWEDIYKVLVCPFGKRHNLVRKGFYLAPGTPPCI